MATPIAAGIASWNGPFAWIMGLVILQRLGELALAGANTRRLLARGAREVGRAHYPLFVLLHGSWLAAMVLTTPPRTQPIWPLIAVFVALQLARVWVIATLGPYWTTRIITLDSAPVVRRGPFRFIRHPNYAVVVGEIAVLPLAFHDWAIAIVWSVLNALLLRHRIRMEGAALAPREVKTSEGAFAQTRSPSAPTPLNARRSVAESER
jgi:methyltransferase